jgi:hypothetical protein
VPKTALILSSGRTGTLFLARYFDANYEGVIGRHEPPPARWLRLASHAHMAGSLSRERLRALLAYKRRRHDDALDADLYVESNPFLSGTIDVLGEVWEDPTIFHVVRDPRDQVRSSLNHGTATGVKGLANRFFPFWYPDVRKILELDHAPSWLERAAGVWVILNSRLRNAAPRYPHYHLLRYEEIFDASHSGLREMCRILGLDYREAGAAVSPWDRINPGRLDALAPWREWTREQCVVLQRICGPLMREFGYGDEPEWRARVSGHG